MNKTIPFHDVIIIGAGLSGIGAGYHIQHACPKRDYVVLEGRAAMGGTWDLFKYPGIRSDSDMYTLGFPFYPWKNPKAIADGPAILSYIKETARHFGIDKKIKYKHKVIAADWDSNTRKWLVEIEGNNETENRFLSCNFLFCCSGYYNYKQGYSPAFPNSQSFRGTIIHPQKWDEKLDYSNKKIVVIGSGATAVTLVPELAKKAKEVVMLQRSPTYIMNLPSEDKVATLFNKILPKKLAYSLSRWKNILLSILSYGAARKWPEQTKDYIQKKIRKELGEDYDMRHFDPKYKPWDQRLCVVPDSDLFHALKGGKARIVTDTIERFTPNGILLDSNKELEADIIVTATGLNLRLLGGMILRKDGEVIDFNQVHCYKGVMLSGVPNFAVAVGYTNASWTLKCDLNCSFVTRVLNEMDKGGHHTCTPRFDPAEFESEPLLDFDAGYIQRSKHLLPKQGDAAPWKVHQNYLKDLRALKYATVRDKYLEYR